MDVFEALSLLSLILDKISHFILVLSCLLKGLIFCYCMYEWLMDLIGSPCILLSDGWLTGTPRCLCGLIYSIHATLCFMFLEDLMEYSLIMCLIYIQRPIHYNRSLQ